MYRYLISSLQTTQNVHTWIFKKEKGLFCFRDLLGTDLGEAPPRGSCISIQYVAVSPFIKMVFGQLISLWRSPLVDMRYSLRCPLHSVELCVCLDLASCLLRVVILIK